MVLGTDLPGAFERSNINMVGFEAAKRAAQTLYRKTGLGIGDVGAIECHDCFSANELITYEALGMAPIGHGADIVDRGDNTYGGKWVVNPSGGLISKGHPIGATGVAQCVELSNQLRGRCGKRQVPNLNIGLQHNIGIGGAVVVAMYKLAYPAYPTFPTKVADSSFASDALFHQIGERAAKVAVSSFASDAFFHQIGERAAKEGAEFARKVNTVFAFVVSAGEERKRWLIDLSAKSTPSVRVSEDKAEVEITAKDADLVAIAAGKLKPDQAFMQGKMKIKGNMGKAMKLREVFDANKLQPKL